MAAVSLPAPNRKESTMNADKVFTLLGSIVTIALVTTIAVHATGVASVTTALGNVFNGALKTAQGN